jgi:ABC-type antimicrobial peptide transport system permease subunit
MHETSFAVNDLFRRKTQTGLIVACLMLTVGSTLFLLLFASRLGVGFAAVNENVLTIGLSLVLAQFTVFVGVLVFVVGAVLVSFTALLMMTQRTRDFGLIKATGCPNDLLFSYYETELVIVTLLGCTLGAALGLGADYAVSSLSGFRLYHNAPNLWFAPVVSVVFFIIALIFGTKPVGDAVKLSPLNALSTVQYYGLTVTSKAKPFTKSNLTVKLALRTLFRRRTASVRIVLLLSVVFVLLTVSVAGGIIAKETTSSWIQDASGQGVIAVADASMAQQYKSLESAFTGTAVDETFNYSNPQLTVHNDVIQQLQTLPGVVTVDQRLILEEHLSEIGNFTYTPNSSQTTYVGDKREGDFVVVGVNPAHLSSSWDTDGRFLTGGNESSVVVGEWLGRRFFEQPLVESVRMQGKQFIVVGVCVDPILNGRVVYAPLQRMQNVTGVYSSNLVLLALDPSIDPEQVMTQVNSMLSDSHSNLVAFSLDQTIQNNVNFLGSTWSTVMLLPIFTLTTAVLCLVGYVMLAIEEQRQEFGFLRAMGARPRTVTGIVAVQSIIVLLSSLGFGLPLGTITTLVILMQHPLVTTFTIAEIAAWLLTALAGMFALSLAPAVKLARAPLLRLMT